MNRQIVTLRITQHREQVAQCSSMGDPLFAKWEADRGKPVKVYLPPLSKPNPFSCDEMHYQIVETDGLEGAHYCNGRAVYICRHFLEMD